MYSFFIKEIENEYTLDTLKKNYKKILITIMPIVPHFSSECLKLLDTSENLKWPKFDEAILVENFVNLVIQINGKKRGLLKIKKNISEDEVLMNIKKEKNISKYLEDQNIKKKIFIPNRLAFIQRALLADLIIPNPTIKYTLLIIPS